MISRISITGDTGNANRFLTQDLKRVYLGTAPWKINFAHFLVTRTIWYALSDGSHKKIQKCLKSAKIGGQSSKFREISCFTHFFNYNCPKRYLVKLGKVRDLYHKKALLIS